MPIDFNSLLSPLISVLIWGAVIIVMCVVGYFVYIYSKYKYTCLIYEKRGEDKSQLIMDKGGFFKLAGGDWVFKFMKRRHNIKPPDSKHIWIVGKRNTIHFRHLGSDLYQPFSPKFYTEDEEDFLQNIDYDESLSWGVNTRERLKVALDLKNIWEKYGMLIVSFVTFLMVIVVIYLLLKFVRGTVGDVTGAVKQQTNFLKSIFESAMGGSTSAPQ